jgi:hypothetical protein
MATAKARPRGPMDRFKKRNLRVAGSTTVHGVRATADAAGISVPTPACGTPLGGWDWSKVEATKDTISCKRCGKIPAVRAADAEIPRGLQLALAVDYAPPVAPAMSR